MLKKTKRVLKTILDGVWSIRRPQYQNRILYYHSVHPSAVDSHKPDLFRKQLLWLKDNGYRSVLIRDVPSLIMKDHNKNARPWVAITFDDGYQDNVQYALPIIAELGFVATFFVVAGMVQSGTAAESSEGYRLCPSRLMMNVQDLQTLVNEGMEVGSHTMTHQMMTRVLARSPESAEYELAESKKILEDVVGNQVSSFSYPNGQRGAFSSETGALIKAHGYLAGCTTMWGSIQQNSDIFELPRCEVALTDSLDKFIASVCGQREYLAFVYRIFDRSKAWSE